jgi:hypothetical protein
MGGSTASSYRQIKAKALPPIKAVAASTFATPDCESDDPQHEKDGCQYPQYVKCEPGPKKNQHE